MEQGLLNVFKYSNNKHPTIIEYRNKRQLLQTIVNDIFYKEVDTHYNENMKAFEKQMYKLFTNNSRGVNFITPNDGQFLIKLFIYNFSYSGVSSAINYKNKCRYKIQEKIDMLDAVCNNTIGLFQIISFDNEKTKFIRIKNIDTNEEFNIVDEGLLYSCLANKDKNKILLLRLIQLKDYAITDGFVELKDVEQFIKICKNKKIKADIDMLLIAKKYAKDFL